MANSPNTSQQAFRDKYGNCAICKNYIGISASKITCCKCSIGIHQKCFQMCIKVFEINEINWICRDCSSVTDTAATKTDNSNIEVLLQIVLNQLSELKEEVNSLKKTNSELLCQVKRVDYSSATKSDQRWAQFHNGENTMSNVKVNAI